MNLSDVLVRPIVTEKSTREGSSGKYFFIVNKKTNKIEIKHAIEKLYGIKVKSVNVINNARKEKIGRNRAVIIKRPTSKKVIITTFDKKNIDINKFKELK